ncbi:MAG: hypothetical protein QM844_11500 [Planctomycetota bacterium]|jgi:hypothetical protein|nr:hypothetical protein [Planctomycetota bacterium]
MSLHDLQSRRTAGFPVFVSLSIEMLQRLRDIKGTAPDGRKEP